MSPRERFVLRKKIVCVLNLDQLTEPVYSKAHCIDKGREVMIFRKEVDTRTMNTECVGGQQELLKVALPLKKN